MCLGLYNTHDTMFCKKNRVVGWGDRPINTALATPAQRPEFTPQHPCEQLDVLRQGAPSPREVEAASSLGLPGWSAIPNL